MQAIEVIVLRIHDRRGVLCSLSWSKESNLVQITFPCYSVSLISLKAKLKQREKITSVERRTHGKSINNPISFETSFKLFNAIQNLSEYPELLRFHPKFLFYLDRY